MKRLDLLPLLTVTLLAGDARASQDPGSQEPVRDPVAERLETSPRHHEWVDVERGDRTVRAFVAFPEVAEPALAVLVIHENRGLNDWARSVADELAEAGYLAIAPDLLSGVGPEGGGTASFATSDAARSAIYELDPDDVMADLGAVAAHARALPACDGRLVVAGFCWGGGKSFEFAAAGDPAAAFVFYGRPPEPEVFAQIGSPVHGFYGENDARITATVDATRTAMMQAGRTFEPEVYAGAGHGFMRSGGAVDARPEDRAARAAAWERWKKLLAAVPAADEK